MTDEYDRLSAWLTAAGGHHRGIAIRELDGMRGVVATLDIATGDELARVPPSLLITLDRVQPSPVGRALRAAGATLSSEYSQLAAWLLAETRAPASAFRPYLDALPRTLAGFPLTATPEQLELLDGSLTGAMLAHLRDQLTADHQALVATVPALAALTLDELIWARSCVSSRCFRRVHGDTRTHALIPVVDMLNHAPGPNARWRFDDDGFVLFAERAYRAGEQIHCDYGAKPNMYFLLHYGFCFDPNDADQAVLGADEQIRVTRDHTEPFAQLMLAQLRARSSSESGARTALADAARAGLARFSTTLADDEALLATELSPTARNFVVARLGEKRVLHAWLALADHGPPALFAPD